MRVTHLVVAIIGVLVGATAEATEIHIQAPGWTIEKIGFQSPKFGLTGAEAALTLPIAPDRPIFLRRLSARALPKTDVEWSQVVLGGRKATIFNQSLKFQNGRPRYIVEFEFRYSQESSMRALVLATIIDGEIYSLSYGRDTEDFGQLAPEVLKLFRSVKLSSR